MNISRFSIAHPVTTVMATFLLMLLGFIALFRLPIDLMPDIALPRLSISTDYEGAGPQEIEELVTRPIEEAVSTVAGVSEVESLSAEGRSRVDVGFDWDVDIDAAANDVRDRLDRVIALLPEDAERPSLRKFNPSDFPIMMLGVASDMNPTDLRDLVDRKIKYRIERAEGVAAVSVEGGNEREIHVDLYADRIKALGLPLDQVVLRISEGNVDLPAGDIDRGHLDIRIRTPGTYKNLDELRETIVAVVNDVPVRVRDVADVVDSWKKKTNYVLINGVPGVRMRINKQSGANTVEVAQAVHKEIDAINREFSNVEVTPVFDTSKYVQQSISNMGQSAAYGGILAVFVLLFFLRNIRSTVVVAVAIPVSIVATFILIYFGNFTLNIMTMGGLALGIGMLVDNAIVVIENILRLRDGGLRRDDAARDGSEEVTAAIIASTLTTLVVFLPLVFMRGMAGIMFTQLALVVSFALFCSLVVALSLVPMLSSKLLRPTKKLGRDAGTLAGRARQFSASIFSGMESGYRRILGLALDNRAAAAAICVAVLAGSVLLARGVGTELMPEVDEGEVRVEGDMNVGTRVDVMVETFNRILEIVKRVVPEMENAVTFVGGRPWRPGASNNGEIRISLKPLRPDEGHDAKEVRTRSDEQIVEALEGALKAIPGVRTRTRRGQGLFLLRMMTRGMERLSVDIFGHDLDKADELAKQLEQRIRDVDGVTDTRREERSGMPEEVVRIDRRKAEEMKLSVARIGDALRTVLAGTRAGEFREGGYEYTILVKVKGAERLLVRDILDLTVTNALGQPVVLRNVVSVEPAAGPIVIERRNKERVVDIRVNIRGRDMGSIAADIQKIIDETPVSSEMEVTFGGDVEEQAKTFRELAISFALAVLLVYMVMACLFESLRDPFVVMFSVPFAAIGVIAMLYATNTTLNMQSFIGCIMLAGIVVNNAILLVDHTNLLRRRDRMPLFEAIKEAGRRRLRPILMTALTTSLALTPLALGWGEGGEAQAPMARAVIGGLLSSTLVTLVLVPVMHSLFAPLNEAHFVVVLLSCACTFLVEIVSHFGDVPLGPGGEVGDFTIHYASAPILACFLLLFWHLFGPRSDDGDEHGSGLDGGNEPAGQ